MPVVVLLSNFKDTFLDSDETRFRGILWTPGSDVSAIAGGTRSTAVVELTSISRYRNTLFDRREPSPAAVVR